MITNHQAVAFVFIALCVGAILGVVALSLCVAARGCDSFPPSKRIGICSSWSYDGEFSTLSYGGLDCAIVCGPGTSQPDHAWLGEAMADALNQAHVAVPLPELYQTRAMQIGGAQ